jgi:hypothetical protein
MEYYIQGDAAKADQINAAFKKLGYDTSGHLFNANSVLYFTLDGEIRATTCNCTPAIIKTHPDYQELELPVEFKDGDIIGFNDCTHNDGSYVDWVGIYKRKRDDSLNQNQHLFHCVVTSIGTFRTGGSWRVFTAYPATKEQRGLLFSKMKEAGYEWDEKKKELRKIQPHYDIANFQPFDKVLVRNYDTDSWTADLFSHYVDDEDGKAFVTICSYRNQCIPFEGNEHLLGTTDMCDEMYINW